MGVGEIVSGSSFGECFKPLWAGTASDRSYLALALLSQSSLSPSPAFYQPRCLCSYMWTGELIQLKTGKEKKKRKEKPLNFRQFLWLVCHLAAQIAAMGRGWWWTTIKLVMAGFGFFLFLFFIFFTYFQTFAFGVFWKSRVSGSWLCWFSSTISLQAAIFLCCFSWPAASCFQMCVLLLCWILESHLRIVLSLHLWLLWNFSFTVGTRVITFIDFVHTEKRENWTPLHLLKSLLSMSSFPASL